MKFFDLEMNDCLAIVRRGGRSVSYNEGTTCENYKFTHGTNFNDCMANAFKVGGNAYCKTTVEPIK